jgi:hypothetical protein
MTEKKARASFFFVGCTLHSPPVINLLYSMRAHASQLHHAQSPLVAIMLVWLNPCMSTDRKSACGLFPSTSSRHTGWLKYGAHFSLKRKAGAPLQSRCIGAACSASVQVRSVSFPRSSLACGRPFLASYTIHLIQTRPLSPRILHPLGSSFCLSQDRTIIKFLALLRLPRVRNHPAHA